MSHSAAIAAGKPARRDAKQLPKDVGESLTKLGMGLAGLGVVAAGVGYAIDAKRFAFSYLVGFLFVATIALGGLCFVQIQHLTRAGWSVVARRQAEWLAGLMPAVAALFIPVILFSHTLYHHWMGPEAAHDPILQKKAAFLNPNFFYGRAALDQVM